jgi:hypothetical protein
LATAFIGGRSIHSAMKQAVRLDPSLRAALGTFDPGTVRECYLQAKQLAAEMAQPMFRRTR